VLSGPRWMKPFRYCSIISGKKPVFKHLPGTELKSTRMQILMLEAPMLRCVL